MVQVFRVFTLAVAAIAAAVSPLVAHKQSPVVHQVRFANAASVLDTREDSRQQMTVRLDTARQDAADRAAAEAAAQAQAEAEAKAKADAEAASAAAAAATARRAQVPVPAAAPAPAPAPAPPANYGSGSIQDMIRSVFAPYGPAAVDWGLRVARCESGYNPNAVGGGGAYFGLFQFMPATFRNTPYGNQNILDPFYNASAAAWKYSVSGGGAWGCK